MPIPKIIHSIWIGGAEKIAKVKKCEASWREHLKDYTFMEWNEQNLDIDAYPYARQMYQRKAWAFASDPLRLMVLQKHGGIYMDVDIFVKKTFDPLLDANFIIGFAFDSALGAGVIGAAPQSPVVAGLLKMYDGYLGEPIVNNSPITWYFLKRYSKFRLTGDTQLLPDKVQIYHRKYFDSPTYDARMGYSFNSNLGSWSFGQKGRFPRLLKNTMRRMMGQVLYNDMKMKYALHHILEFYPTYKLHKAGKDGFVVPGSYAHIAERV